MNKEFEQKIKQAEAAFENVCYGIGMTEEKNMEILMTTGRKYIELTQKCETNEAHQIALYEYVQKTYQKENEKYTAANMIGRITADGTIKSLFSILCKLEKLREE